MTDTTRPTNTADAYGKEIAKDGNRRWFLRNLFSTF